MGGLPALVASGYRGSPVCRKGGRAAHGTRLTLSPGGSTLGPMSINRVFLDWDRPALVSTADYLLRRFGSPGTLDLAGVIVAVPGGRAGRRLLEILVDRAERDESVLSPPPIMTLGRLPEKLYEAKKRFADELVQQLAWIEALKLSDPDRLKRLTPAAPAEDDLAAWLALGEMLGRLHRELAADGLDFQDVANCGQRIEGFREQKRWQALAEIQRAYLRTLDGFELWDLQTARLFAVRQGECRTDAQIVLVGTVDMNRAQRLMLDQVADRVTALVFAPRELADRFDEHGCALAEAWQDVPIDLSDERIEVVDDPRDQAAAVVRAIASLDGKYGGEQITVGVPDERIVPYIEQYLRQCEVPARYGVGLPVARSVPCRLLDVVADYLESKRFSAFAAVVRHPAVHDWLAGRNIPGDWLTQMDEYFSEHLPYKLEGRRLGETEEQFPSRAHPSPRAASRGTLKQVHEAIESLLDDLSGDARALDRWGQPIAQLLVNVFGTFPLDSNLPADRAILVACEKILGVLRSHLEISRQNVPLPEVTGADAIRMVLGRLEGEKISPPSERGAVELLGWLELPSDDAAVSIVTGFNEGIVPGAVNADLFLPNQLRRELGIEDNDRRYARDAYALSLLLASRTEVRLIAGRRTGDGDPLTPSRLLFACDPRTSARRVLRFFASEESAGGLTVLPGTLTPGRKQSALDIPRPRPLAQPVTSMRVTEFRDYLACPYRYYLRHRLKLAGLSDTAEELDGGAFGSLAHSVLGQFGSGPVASSTDAQEIQAWLNQALDRIVAREYGPGSLAAISVQIEQLRRRLEALARWQADWARQGWRIEHVETGPKENQAALVVDGRPMYLRGRIDRIDVRESTGERIIFDYKTSDTPKTPEKVHRRGGEWIDLQLPLYRRLARGMGIEGPVGLGYIVLPKDTGKVGHLPAEWTDDELRQAEMIAEEVVGKVRAEAFWPPAEEPPPFAEEFAAICLDDQFGAAAAAADAQGGSP